MARNNLFSLLFAILLLLGLVLSCNPPKAKKAQLKCDDQKFVTSGTANDADASNGPGVTYTDPARTANDANTSGTSDPKTCRQLGGQVIAQPGPQAPAGSNAGATATNKATSTFDVDEKDTYQYDITTTVTAALTKGSGKVHVVARVLDQNNAVVPGSDFQVIYQFRDKGNNKIGITVNNEPEIEVGNPATAWQDGDRIGPPQAFTLTKGKYTFQFEVNFEALAPPDGKADIKGISSVDLK